MNRQIDVDPVAGMKSDLVYHWFAYFYGLQKNRTLKLHHVRDGSALMEIGHQLGRRGYTYGRQILNGPPTWEEVRSNRETMLRLRAGNDDTPIEDVAAIAFHPLDDSFLRPGNLLVVPTRPPLDDLPYPDKVRSQPGFTSLEQKIFRLCRDYLEQCSRSWVMLKPEIALQLPETHGDRACIEFRQNKEGWYKTLARRQDVMKTKAVDKKVRKTMAYLLHLTEVESLHGADLLLFFGPGGTETLVFAHRLRTDLAHLLDEPGFAMVEMTGLEGHPGHDLGFADRWRTEVILRAAPIQRARPSRRSARVSRSRKARPRKATWEKTSAPVR